MTPEEWLEKWVEGHPPDALEYSEKYKALEIPGRTAHKRAKGEKRDRRDEITFSSKEPAQPSGHRDDDGIGCKIGCNGPGGFVDSSGQATADMIEGDIDD